MKMRFAFAAAFLGLALTLTSMNPLPAAPGSGKGKRGVTVSGRVTTSPTSIKSPISGTNKLTVCVSGFVEGNFVTVSIPWVGSVDYHSFLSFSRYIDPSGGFCVDYPPDWTAASLEAGTYSIETAWYSDGSSGDRNSGPSGTFDVLGN